MANAQGELTNAQPKTASNRIATGTHAMLTTHAKLKDALVMARALQQLGKDCLAQPLHRLSPIISAALRSKALQQDEIRQQ